jgi:hypothetical protein
MASSQSLEEAMDNSEPLSDGDVETRSNRGQWENRVIGDEARSQSFTSKDEAIDAGRQLAAESGTRHVVRDSDPTGVITDEQETS